MQRLWAKLPLSLRMRVGGAAASLTPEGMTGEGAHRRGALLVASAVFALASGFSLASAAARSSSSAPLVIAVEGPQSGAQAANGVDRLRGVRPAGTQLNTRRGRRGGRKGAGVA